MALNDVGKWLEQSLRHYSTERSADLLTELGWLKRTCRYHAALNRAKDRFNQVPDRSVKLRREFGDDLDSLREKRRKVQECQERKVRRQAEEAAAKPKRLPDRFEVVFEDFGQARQAYQNAKKRMKKGKATKPARLMVLPVDDGLKPLAEGLACITTETEGFIAYFEFVEQQGGGQCPMFVEGTRDGEGATGRIVVKLIPGKV